jgi:DNA-binding NarL/FixJ family response regulator
MKILLADDHALFREGLCHVLRALLEEVSVIETADYPETLRAARDHPDLDLVLLDLRMPGMDGLAGVEAVRSERPEVPLVVISAVTDRRFVLGAIDRGAAGYIPKTLSGKVLIGALNLILSGGVYLPAEAISTGGRSVGAERGGGEDPPPKLTRRQTDVFGLLALGLSNREIGRRLALSEGTVKLHVAALLKKLGVNNRTQAAVKAARLIATPGDAPPA